MNLPSGESLVRQIVHGQRYFQEHFGVRCTEVWIPDVFGYPAGLPQIYRGRRACDASSPRSCRGTAPTASRTTRSGGRASTAAACSRTSRRSTPTAPRSRPAELAYSVERFAEHAWSGWSLVPFGYGDGGGGPTREMLERAAPAGRPRRHAARRARCAERVLRPRRGRGVRRRAGAGVARRAVLRDASRHVDEPARARSSATVAASGCCARWSCGAPRRPCAASTSIRTSSTACGARC